MPLQAPILDDRNFEQLLEEARLRIPLYTPEWTNFNDSDPGMALVQLFAWFTELMLYKMNQVPNRLYIKFLKMLNLELRPAQPARTHVVFIPGPEAKLTTVSERTRFDVDVGEEGVPFFETLSAFDLCPFKLDRVQVFDGTRYRDVTTANETGTLTYKPFGPAAQLGSALYLGFKPQEPKNRREQFPERMLFRFFYPKFADQPDGAAYTARSGPSVTTLQRLVWEYRSEYDRVGNRPPQQWRQLATIDDKTLALTKEGDVLIHGPREDIVPTIEGELTSEGEGPRDEAPEDGEAKRYWLRLRLAQGAYSNDKIPHISFVQTNVVEVENLTTLTDEELGQSDGRPDQTFTLGNRPVDKDSLEIVVEVPNRREPDSWNRVDDFLASQRTARHYTLNPTTGEIKFGDGKHGLIPEPGGIIRAMRYRYGGGENGNVKPDTITAIPGSLAGIESVTNPRAARGGKPEEDLKDLIRRAPLALLSGGRAVTNNDFRQIAEAVPGVLKAHVAPGYHPAYPGHPIPGAVTVFIVPDTLRTERGGA
ncbi:MAG: putative baseplate assembly protein [Gemmataceae bacterium]